MNQVVNDVPVKNTRDDVLDRKDFAFNIADVVAKRNDKESFVISLEGAWGSGKTSILNFIEERVEACHKDIIIIKFNPWRYSGEDQLLLKFFNEIASALDQKLKTKSELVKEFFKKHTEKLGTLISAAAGDPTNSSAKVAAWLSSFLKSSDIDEFKKRVQELLSTQQKRILFFIDDIDRLPNKEIQELFKVIKLIGDFKYVTYILCFDQDAVLNALSETFPDGKTHSFLEKIVQLSIKVPKINKQILRNYWASNLKIILDENNIALEQSDLRLLMRYMDEGFLHSLDDLRKIKNIENSLRYLLPFMKDKIYVVDLIVIESIKVFYPRIYETFRKHSNLIFAHPTRDLVELIGRQTNDKSHYRQKLAEEINDLFDLNKLAQAKYIIKMIKDIFPSLYEIFNNTNKMDNGRDYKKKMRVGCSDFYDRYFSFNLNPNEFPEAKIYHLLSFLDNKEKYIEEYKSILKNYSQYEIFEKLYIQVDELKNEKLENFLLMELEIYNFIAKDNYQSDGLFPISAQESWGIKWLRLIELQLNESEKIIFKLIDSKLSNNIFTHLFCVLKERSSLWENENIKQHFAFVFQEKIKEGLNIFDFKEKFIISSFIYLLDDYTEINIENYLDSILITESDLTRLIQDFGTMSYGINATTFSLDLQQFESINNFYSSDKIVRRLRKDFPYSFSVSYPKTINSTELAVIDQYLAYYFRCF